MADATPAGAGRAGGYTGGAVIAHVVRSGFVESRHHGSVVVLDAAGATVASAGDVTGAIFPRSANKPFQAAGMLHAGLEPGSTADLALIGASHRGESFHVARVRALLAGVGLDQGRLRCPVDHPLSDPCGERSRSHHNCSGKHTGMLLTCVANGWPLDTYRDPQHPLQRALRSTVEEVTGERVAATGVDGCGAPVWAVSLTALAVGFLRLVSGAGGAAGTAVADAMRAHPEMVSGTGPRAQDTVLMGRVPGALAKGGAEGVQVLALSEVGVVAMKVDDGAQRPQLPVVSWGLRRLGVDVPLVAEPVRGGGEPVGEVRAAL